MEEQASGNGVGSIMAGVPDSGAVVIILLIILIVLVPFLFVLSRSRPWEGREQRDKLPQPVELEYVQHPGAAPAPTEYQPHAV